MDNEDNALVHILDVTSNDKHLTGISICGKAQYQPGDGPGWPQFTKPCIDCIVQDLKDRGYPPHIWKNPISVG